MNEPEPFPTAGTTRVVAPEAIGRGALVGFVALLPVVLVIALLERGIDEFDTSAWAAVSFVLLLGVFLLAGWAAGTVRPDAPLTNGSLAGLGTFVIWIPLRILIWAVRGGQGLVSGEDPVLNPGAILMAFVLAGTFGLLGALLAARRARRSAPAGDPDTAPDTAPDTDV